MNTLASQNCCPFCGSNNVDKITESNEVPVPYALPAQFKTEQLICKDCGMDTDVSNGKKMQDAIDTVTQESVPKMINSLTSNGWTLAKIEHSLSLSERTLSRWMRSPKLSSESIALLRILRTYPWIVQVADRQYQPGYAQGQVVMAAGQIICSGELIGIGCIQFMPVSGANPVTLIAAAIGGVTNSWSESSTISASVELNAA